ncbi:MAG: nucH [Acidobacteria bacterium]|nr:nucH [Acidobacteriota bacterium]
MLALGLFASGAACRGAASTPQGRALTGVVTRVADGDTLDVLLADGRTVTVRLEGADAPEGGQAFGDEARRHLRVFAFTQKVAVLVKEVDQYGRLVARVKVGSADASEEMIGAGLAWHFTRYSSDERLARLEARARQQRLGLWAASSPEAPWAWRGRQRANGAGAPGQSAPGPTPPPGTPAALGPYHANVKSGIYHAPACPGYDCRNCTRVFATRQEADAAGFHPHLPCVFPSK